MATLTLNVLAEEHVTVRPVNVNVMPDLRVRDVAAWHALEIAMDMEHATLQNLPTIWLILSIKGRLTSATLILFGINQRFNCATVIQDTKVTIVHKRYAPVEMIL